MIAALFLAILTLPLIAGCGGKEPTKLPSNQRAPIFRYIDVSPYGMIRLGDSFSANSRLGVELRPGIYRLDRVDGQPVQLGDTRAIFVALTPDHRVCAFYFLYLPEKTFDARVAEYQPDLGPAAMSQADSTGTAISVAGWRDSATSLQLHQTVAGVDTSISAVLADIRDSSVSTACPHGP